MSRSMELLATDILAEARGLSWPLSALGATIGVLLWLFGWRWHRFWVAFLTTSTAGLIGLSAHAVLGPRMLAAGILLAVAAGMLAMDLSRFFAFGVAGALLWSISQLVLPHFHEPLIVFLIGGILGTFLYRLQIRLMTSFIGTLIAFHSILLILEAITDRQFEPSVWAAEHTLGLNIAVIVVTLFGIAVQGQWETWLDGATSRRRSRLMRYLSDAEREQLKHVPSRPKSWFAQFVGN